jgi:hypothetical protein
MQNLGNKCLKTTGPDSGQEVGKAKLNKAVILTNT